MVTKLAFPHGLPAKRRWGRSVEPRRATAGGADAGNRSFTTDVAATTRGREPAAPAYTATAARAGRRAERREPRRVARPPVPARCDVGRDRHQLFLVLGSRRARRTCIVRR